MSDTWTSTTSTDWFTSGNWKTGTNTHVVPVISATGTEAITISAATVVISPTVSTALEIYVSQTLNTSGNSATILEEVQIGGEYITLSNNANLQINGIAMGIFYGNTDTLTPYPSVTGNGRNQTTVYSTMTGLHGALTTTASYDSHMQLIAVGNDTLTVDTVNENFGLITIGNGNTLTINNVETGGNAQALHGLINYGLITVGSGGHLTITAAAANGSTVANFYNAGWIDVTGGTLSISSSVLDGANTASTATTTDGYIEIGGGGDVILSNTVSATEEVTFTDTSANTLQITAGTLFSGTVNNFGPSDTIVVNGFTSTSNATIVTVGGVTELITTNGSVLTTITLTGTTTTQISTSTNSSGQEIITGGGSNSYSSGTSNLTGVNGTITNNSTITVTGSTTDLVVTSPVVGTGAFFIDHSATLALDNTTGNDSTQTVIFGTNGTSAAPNTLLVNDGTAGFGGTVTSFGAGDDIVFGGSTLPTLTTGEGVVLNYNTTSHVLTITETNATGTVIGTETLSITGTAALSAGSFIGLETTAGLNIELAPTVSTGYSFSTTGTGNFETSTNYTGGTAPGDTLSGNMTVSIVAGTASVSAGSLIDNGLITVASGTGFIDAGSLTGTGVLAVASGGAATLTGSTSLASITDAGSLTLGGTVSGPVTVTGAAAVTGTLVDTGSLSGAGTFTVGSGTTASLTGGVSTTTLIDNGSLTVAGVVTSTVSGTGSLTVASGTSASLLGGSAVTTITDSGSLNVMGAVSSNISGTGTLAVGAGIAATLSGTDSITTLADSGSLTVSGTFTDSNAINGTGSLTVSGTASLTGNTTLASITETGTGKLTLGGTDAVAISIASGGQATIASSFSDSSAITGAGSLTVNAGVTATLAAGSSVASVADLGTLNLAGAMGGSINMEGNTANTAVDFNTANGAVSLTNFGTTDHIVLGTGAVTQTAATGAVLSYTGGVLTVTETNAAGGSIASDSVTVSGITGSTLSAASFVALQSTSGVVIELASNLSGTGFTYDGTGTGSFEAPANYAGGTAPGDAIATGETVTIATGTASVSTSGATDNGVITIASAAGFIDAGALTGTGTLAVGSGAAATLTGSTSLASITDAGSLTLGGTVAGAVTIATGGAATASGSLVDNAALTVSGTFTDSNALTGTGTFAVATGGTASLTGNTTLASITDAGTLTLGGTDAVAVTIASGGQATIASNFSDSSAITGAGSLTIKSGVTATLAAGSSVASVSDLGTLDLAGSFGGTVDMHGNGANSVIDFNAANAAASLINFGTSDDIILGSGALNQSTGNGVVLSYASGVLTVTETNSSGATVGTDTVTVAGVSGLTSGSFVALENANGLNIELAPTAATGYTFSASSTGSFEGYSNYTGGTAPGDVLSANESVTIAAGTASVSSNGVTDNGVITIASGAAFTDAKSLSGTGTLTIGTGGAATLTGSTSLASITDAGSLTLGGTVSGPITIASGAAASVSGSLVDTGSISGTGALTVGTGTSATLTGGVSVSTITDSGSLVIAGSVASNITAAGTLAVATGTSATLSGTDSVTTLADSGSLTVSGTFTDSNAITGTGTFAVATGGSAALTGNTTLASITDAGTLTLGGTDAVAVTIASGGQATIASNFSDSQAITGAGSLTVSTGVTATLAAGSSVASVADLGTLNLAGAMGGSINMEGNNANTVVDFNTANAAVALTNFGTTDDIILSSGALATPAAGTGVVLNYNTTSGVLTVSETNSSGTVIATDAITVAGAASLTTGSFVVLENSKGINIELAPTAATAYTFSASSTGSFEGATNYTGGTAPGDVLSANESVTIAAGTASVSTGGVTDNGTIAISGGNFVDNGSLTGTGTLTVGSGHSAQLGGNVSLASIQDSGTIVFLGSSLSGTVDMMGNGADSQVIFGGTGTGATLTDFGTNDLIGLANAALTVPVAGTSGIFLSYNTASGVLTVETTNSSTGSIISTANVTVSGVSGNSLSTASFVALEQSAGTVIELASSDPTLIFSTSGTGSFESPANYENGIAPSDTLTTGEKVSIAAGTASVSNAGVTDNGLITIASGAGFIDAGSLSGTGTLAVGAGGSATLTGATSLASITDAGSLTLAGADAAAISLASGSQVTLSGNFSDSAAINGAGTLTVEAGVTATLVSGSIASVLDAGTLDLAGSFGGSIDMEGNGAGTVVEFTGTSDVTNNTLNTAITNFGYGDTIVLGTADFALNSGDTLSETYNSSTGVLTVTDINSGASLNLNLGLTGGDPASYLTVSGSTGELTLTLCFYPGTALATPSGEIKVEDIVAGDLLMTANGAKPVRWIGQSHIHTGFADPLRSLPIRIRQGALGGGLPVRDLLISPDHAIAIDGVLVQASALVNGSSIIRDYDVPEQFTYYHVELDSHELLLAEGIEAESFVDNVDRMHFHNWDDRTAPETAIAEMDLPRAKSARQVPMAIRRRFGLSQIAVA